MKFNQLGSDFRGLAKGTSLIQSVLTPPSLPSSLPLSIPGFNLKLGTLSLRSLELVHMDRTYFSIALSLKVAELFLL